jgi:hypothetical protein
MIILLLLIIVGIPVKATASQIHIHGEAELTIIIENKMVNVELVAPGESLVGFEHRAKTDRELLILTKIKKTLSNSENIIRLQGGNCLIKQTNIEAGSLISHTKSYKPHHNDHDLSNKKEQVNTHTEIAVQYLFRCKEVSQLSSVSIELFQNFNAIKHINVRWVTTKEQNSKKLHRSNKHVKLR